MATVAKNLRTHTVTLASPSAGPFLVGFRLFDDDTLDIYVNGAPVANWTLSASYSDGYDDTAAISFSAPLAAADVIIIDGSLSPRREDDLLNGGANIVRAMNIELARVWSALAELKRDTGRSVRALEPFDPVPDAIAGRAIIFDDVTGQPVAGPTTTEISNAQAYAQAASDDADAAEAAAAVALATSGAGFPTRAAFVAAVAAGYLNDLSDGQIVPAATWLYRKAAGATEIADAHDWLPANIWTVCHFGAGLGGDDTNAFSAAAKGAASRDTLGPPNHTSTVPRANTATVVVPDEEYTLTDVVDAGVNFVTWEVSPGAKINGADYLNGRVTVIGLSAINGYSFGIMDANTAFHTVIGGEYGKKPAAVTGVANLAALANYAQIDGVSLVAGAYSRPPLLTLTSGSVSYSTATLTITPAIASEKHKRLRKGQVITTQHPSPYIGVIDSWATVSGNTVITLGDGGWYTRGSGGSGPQNPAGGYGCLVDVVEKLWPFNIILNLTADGAANSGIGSELSCRNLGKPSGTDLDSGSRTWGYGALAAAYGTPGYEPSQAAFVARGWWWYGFASQDQDQGFRYQTTGANKTAFVARMPFSQVVLNSEDTSNGRRYRINASGDTEHGDPAVSTAGGRSVSFHTSGLGAAYDTRILATLGTSSQGQGTLTFQSANNLFGGIVRPTQDNVFSSGSPSFRWSTVYAGTGTINTSDERLKTDIGAIPDEWLDAWGDVDWSRYRWKDAVAEKGDAARWHLGLIAQDVERAFASRGLDAFSIGILCRDEVIETVTVFDTEQRPVMEEVEVEDYLDEVADGKIVHRKITRLAARAKTIMMDVVDENGNLLMDEVRDPDSPDDERRTIKVPMRREIPVMEAVEIAREQQHPTGQWRYGLRYSEAFAIEAAWQRREIRRLMS